MSAAARLILLGMLLALGGVAAFIAIDWAATLARWPHYVRPLKSVVGVLLNASWYWAFAVPALLLVAALYRFAVKRTGRLLTFGKVFAYFTLWAIGSVAFFFGLFLTYAPSFGTGGVELLVPALLACLGYLVIGVGFVLSVARTVG